MAAKKKGATKARSAVSAGTLQVMRGGEKFDVVEAPGLFAIKRRRGTSRGRLRAAHDDAASFAGLEFLAADSTADVEVFRVAAANRDQAMQLLREQAIDSHWCAHVYHFAGAPDGLLIPSDAIYVEVAPGANSASINGLLAEHGLEAMPADDRGGNCYILRLTTKSTQNPIKIANAIARHPAIKVAEPDFTTKLQLHVYRPSDPLFTAQWHLENRGGVGMTAGADVRAPWAWDVTRGSRTVAICVMDDGVQLDHPDFAAPGKVVSPRDFGDQDLDPSPTASDDNHGTSCAGVAVAEENGSGVVGIAPGCALMPYRTSGFINDQAIADLFDSAREDGAAVISCSWGVNTAFYTLSTRMQNVIHRAATEGRGGRGCVIVFASGNEDSPVDGIKNGVRVRSGFAIHPDVIAVNASTSNDVRSHYSNYGKETWVAAPSSGAGGRGIVTTDRTGSAGYQNGDYTTVNGFGGTSSACPLVAGVCGLMLSANPALTAQQVKDILRDTAVKIDQANGNYGATGHSAFYGYGRVDAYAAVAEARRRSAPPTVRRVAWESAPGLAIPDLQPAGVSDTIQVPETARVAAVEVSVRIRHSFRGDLRVELIGPDGTTVRLHDRAGGTSDDLVATWRTSDTPGLSAFADRAVRGAWSLRVSDHAAQDIGALEHWGLVLELANSSGQTDWEARPGLTIPDNDAAGIASEIVVTESGPLTGIAVAVDITHSWRGDLRVVLETPNGIAVPLHDRAGDMADDLVRTYTPADTSGLAALVQAAADVRGTWRLAVSDRAAHDHGKLNAWKLVLSTSPQVLVPQPLRKSAPRVEPRRTPAPARL